MRLAAKKFDSIIVIIEEIDYIGNQSTIFKVMNGHKKMGLVTGTGSLKVGIIDNISNLDKNTIRGKEKIFLNF